MGAHIMTTGRTLLVAYLSTPGGQDALALGVVLARSLHADLDVCMILPPPSATAQIAATGNADFAEILDEQATRWLTEATDRIPDDVPATSRVAFHDNAAEGLVAEAQATGCAAIVVGGSGGGLVGRHSLGSVVNDVLHASTTPVVLTPRGSRDTACAPRRITCAIGRRPGTAPLVRAAVDACARTALPLRLVSLVTDDDHVTPWRRDADDDAARAAAAAHLADVLAQARAELGENHPITSAVVPARTTEDAITSLHWDDGDLIFVGSSRLAQPRHLFLGSTAAKMLRALSVPMIVVPKDS
ncbi:universal stress protein [Gordonia polyisoprenivorans]|uniref:universal stress protein n=1 Tax=Gordonia polyisoprenivorans TaxID=84595 RepID=UPI003D78A1A3